MTAREQNHPGALEAAARREWLRPTVQQLAAGSAEDSSGPAIDGITNPS
jgi:hypothetical protein